mgnify:FL=1
MIINTPISLGELVDKISILKIKEKNINDKEKRALINQELTLLEKILEKALKDKNSIQKYLDELININSKLWKIEDELRENERKKNFDQEFIELARSVYFINDQRSQIKYKINKKFGSQIIEVKSYAKY